MKFILRKKPFKELLVCTSTWIVILLYSVAFYSSTGIFSLSDPMPRQLMLVTIERGYYKDYKDENFVEVVDECLSDNSEESKKRAVWSAYWAVKSEYDLPEIQSIAKECIKKNIDTYLVDEAKSCASVIRHSFLDNSYVNYKEKSMTIVDIFNKIFNNLEPIHTLLLGLVSVVLALRQLFKNKTLDWLMVGFAVFICGIFFSTMIATNDEFVRTMIHIVPLGYLSVAYFIGKYAYQNQDYIEKL